MYKNNVYINPNWKWVIPDHDKASENDKWFLARYKLKGISSFQLSSLINFQTSWKLTIHSGSKIQKWISSRLSLDQTIYKTVSFKEGELEQFLDEFDMMMELLYGKS